MLNWNSEEFKLYSSEQRIDLENALNSEKSRGATDNQLYSFDIKPYNYQQEILDKLNAERVVRGFNRNLLVAATGERVIIVTGCINVLVSRVSGTLTKYNSCIA